MSDQEEFNSLPTSGVHLLITFSNSLDLDQARHLVWPDLDSNCLILPLMEFLKESFENKNFEKINRKLTKNNEKHPACKEYSVP